MVTATHTASVGKTAIWTGRIISSIAVAFLTFDTVIKVFALAPAVEATTQLGYPASAVVGIGLVQLVCLAAYIFPRSSVLGAVLMTGYLGGAVATHVRAESPVFSLVFPVMIGGMLWAGLMLRDRRLRDFLFR